AEAETLILRAEIEFVDLAVIEQAACAVATVVRVTGHLVAEGQNGDAAAFADRAVPPIGSPARHQLFEFQSGDHTLIRAAPRLVMGVSDGHCVGRLGPTNLDQDSA